MAKIGSIKDKLECKCECHKPGWGGKKHGGYYLDKCQCEDWKEE